ncbi:TetR/AcrR family transcriptional regulator [Arthrobacter sp. SLBN-53]|uniref:TetR/AcrR family transcriptional regulator n=1 Tax=Arthrobacter sp. SLBN-53 TaxID=2768412 RepID=UPI00116F8AC0|nr:TetR/AcrR family transcriptional regulator [Arthrobacter sp. SLBN-53]TQK27548.1 TetR family transcriptional regulator [Arthrobacter sp. SLBN-53]
MPADAAKATRRRNPGRPQPRGEHRRHRLLAVLAEHLEHQSLADISVAAVAEEAGLARSAFYFYFSSKNEAVTHLLGEIFDTQIDEASRVISRPGDPRVNLSDSLQLAVQSWVTQRRRFLAMLDARDADPETREIWEAWLRRYEDFVAGYIDEHRSTAPIPSRELAHSLISLNALTLERHLRGTGLASAESVHAALEHIWVNAIYGEPTSTIDRSSR